MRTTVWLDDALMAEMKALAARTGRTPSQLIGDSLQETLARHTRVENSRIQLPVKAAEAFARG